MEQWKQYALLPDSFFEDNFPADNNFELSEILGDFDDSPDVERMTLAELRDFFQNAAEQVDPDSPEAEWVQFIPMIAGAIPSVVQGITSLVKGFGSKSKKKRVPSAPAQSPQPGPAPDPVADPGSALSTLLGLFQNPALLNTLQQIGGSRPVGPTAPTTPNMNIPVGNTNIPVGSILQVISQLAGAMGGGRQEGYPDFLFDKYGNALTDLDSHEAVGRLILQQLKR